MDAAADIAAAAPLTRADYAIAAYADAWKHGAAVRAIACTVAPVDWAERPDTAAVVIDGRSVMVELAYDEGPYVVDLSDDVPLLHAERIDLAIAASWDAQREAA